MLNLDTAHTVLLGCWERMRWSSVIQHQEDGRWHQIVNVSRISCNRMIEWPSRRSHRLDAWLRLTWPPTWPSDRLDTTTTSSLDSMLDSIHSFKPISSYLPLLLSTTSSVAVRTSVDIRRRVLESEWPLKLPLNENCLRIQKIVSICTVEEQKIGWRFYSERVTTHR